MEKKTEEYKRMTREAKIGSGKTSVKLSTETALTHCWQFYPQIEGCAAITTAPDLVDAKGALLSQASKRAQHYSKVSSSTVIGTMWMKGSSGKCRTEHCH